MCLRHRHFLFRNGEACFRGITLAELIVVSAVLVVVMGILLGILIETKSSTVKGQDQIALESQARLVADEVRALLQSAIHPASLDLSISSAPRFSKNECAIISSKNFNGKDFYLTTIHTRADSDTRIKQIEVYRSILDPEKTIDKREEKRLLGSGQKDISCSVEFEYAHSAEQALELKPFQPELAAQEYPRVVRIKVHVEPAGKKGAKIVGYDLITAVRIL